MQRAPVGIAAEQVAGAPDTISVDRDERHGGFFLRRGVIDLMRADPGSVVIGLDQPGTALRRVQFCIGGFGIQSQEHVVQPLFEIAVHPEEDRIHAAVALIFDPEFRSEFLRRIFAAGEEGSAFRDMGADPFRQLFRDRHFFRQDQQFVLVPALVAVRQHDVELHLEFLQHPDTALDRHQRAQFMIILRIDQRNVRQIDCFFIPWIVFLQFVIHFRDPVEHRLVLVAARMEMAAHVRPHAVRQSVKQVEFQAFRGTQSAEIAPAVETARHVQDLCAGLDIAHVVRHGRQEFIAPAAGRQTFAVKERVLVLYRSEHRSVEIQHRIGDDLFDRFGDVVTVTEHGLPRKFPDRLFIRVIDPALFHHLDAVRADAGIVAETVDEEAVHGVIRGDFFDHRDDVGAERRVVADRDRERGQFTERIGPRHVMRRPFAVFDRFHRADPAVEVSHERDAFLFAAFRQPAEQIIFERGMLDPDFGVIVGHADVAPGVERHVIHAAALDLIGEIFRIEILPDVRVFHVGVIVVKQSVLDLMHDRIPFSFYSENLFISVLLAFEARYNIPFPYEIATRFFVFFRVGMMNTVFRTAKKAEKNRNPACYFGILNYNTRCPSLWNRSSVVRAGDS